MATIEGVLRECGKTKKLDDNDQPRLSPEQQDREDRYEEPLGFLLFRPHCQYKTRYGIRCEDANIKPIV